MILADTSQLLEVFLSRCRVPSSCNVGLVQFAVLQLSGSLRRFAVESVGADAYLYGESVLGMLGLTVTNPTWIYVATARRVRKLLSDGIRVCRVVGTDVPTCYEGIRSQRVANAIIACRKSMRMDRLLEALANGVAQGYVGKDEAKRVRKELSK